VSVRVARVVFWAGIAGLLWMIVHAILVPLRVTT
jgi:hypothetical protein